MFIINQMITEREREKEREREGERKRGGGGREGYITINNQRTLLVRKIIRKLPLQNQYFK